MAKSENKTQATRASADAYLAALADEGQRNDCQQLAQWMSKASGEPAVMWGTGMVGFGQYHYRYESGREGDWLVIGFAPRKGQLSIYLSHGLDQHETLLQKLGPHKRGVGCLYLKRLQDADAKVLQQLLRAAMKDPKA